MFSRSTQQIAMPLRISARRRTTPPASLPSSRFSKRCSSTGPSDNAKPQGSLNHTNFYKTFSRPIAKVLLMAMFTYQFAYYFWVRLEKNEKKAELQATISGLEARVEELEKAKMSKKR